MAQETPERDPWDEPTGDFEPEPYVYVPKPYITLTVTTAQELTGRAIVDADVGLIATLAIGDSLTLHFTGGGTADDKALENIDHLAGALAALRIIVAEQLAAMVESEKVPA